MSQPTRRLHVGSWCSVHLSNPLGERAHSMSFSALSLMCLGALSITVSLQGGKKVHTSTTLHPVFCKENLSASRGRCRTIRVSIVRVSLICVSHDRLLISPLLADNCFSQALPKNKRRGFKYLGWKFLSFVGLRKEPPQSKRRPVPYL